jgi:hypothetical protein
MRIDLFLPGKKTLWIVFWKLLKNLFWEIPSIRVKIKRIDRTEEWTVPVLPHHPCAERDDYVYLFRNYGFCIEIHP